MSEQSPNKPGAPFDPEVHHAYWREKYQGEPYYVEGYTYDDYEPAYRAGLEYVSKYPDGSFDEHESTLAHDWSIYKGDSRLDWKEATHAVRAAWEKAKIHRMES